MQRREFLKKSAAVAGLAAAGGLALPATASAAQDAPRFVMREGSDLAGWNTVLGDGVGSPREGHRARRSDVDRIDHGTHSELVGNANRRPVMAHAIAFTRLWNMPSFANKHHGTAHFRIPVVPTMQNWDRFAIQTVEVGVFVWDGPSTRLDYGVAMQWVLNPWIPEFGDLRAWTQNENGPEWVTVGHLEPDTEWHEVDMSYRPDGHGTELRVDGTDYEVEETFTVKHDHWGRTIDGRFQLEVVSCWPGEHDEIAPARAEFRDWSWSIT